ncbi:MAG: hypothetical protein ACI4F7_03515 [Acutalibacteraceae bacterium]
MIKKKLLSSFSIGLCITLLFTFLFATQYRAEADTEEIEIKRYNGWYNASQGVNNFYYVYAPAVYNAASKTVTYDFSKKGDCEFVEWAAGRKGWTMPGKTDYAQMPFVYDDWFFVHKTSTEYAFGMEFRAPESGYYYVDAMLAGKDGGYTAADGDGFISDLVVNNKTLGTINTDNENKPIKGDYWSPVMDMNLKNSSFNLSRYVYLNSGDTATLYIHAKTNIAFDNAAPRMLVTYYGNLEYTHEYAQIYSSDYSDMDFKPVFGEYNYAENKVTITENRYLHYTTAPFYGRVGWRLPGQEDGLPIYSSWGDFFYADNTKALGFEFTAPETGIYDVSVIAKGGDGYAMPSENDPSVGDGYGVQIIKDGVALNIMSTDSVYVPLEKEEELYNNAFERIELLKGEQIFIMYTALGNTWGDSMYPSIKINAALNVPPNPELLDPDDIYNEFKMNVGDTVCVGADSNSSNFNGKDGVGAPMKGQGEYNFYYVYGIPDENGVIDINALKQARPVNKSIRSMFLNLEYTDLCPRVEDIKRLGGGNVAGFFGFTYDGALGSSDMFYPAVQFRAPEDGKYRVELDLCGGNMISPTGEFYENTNGMQWRIYDNKKNEIKVFDYSDRAATENDSAYTGDNYKKVFEMKKGECITLLCDNNQNSRHDMARFSFKATMLDPNDDGYERGITPSGTAGKTVTVKNTASADAKQISWDKIPNATAYRIQLYKVEAKNVTTSPFGVGLVMDDGFETENDFITIYDLNEGEDYYFQVIALNANLATAAYSVNPLAEGVYKENGTAGENGSESGNGGTPDGKPQIPQTGDKGCATALAVFTCSLCCAVILFGVKKRAVGTK